MHEGHHDILEDLDDLDAAFGKTLKKEEKKSKKSTPNHDAGADKSMERDHHAGEGKITGKDSGQK